VKDANEPPDKRNLNSATLEQLMGLPGSNRFLAMRILTQRQYQGPFDSFADLEHIRGVTTSLLKQWAEVAVIGPGEEAPEIAAAAVVAEASAARYRAGEDEPILFAGNSHRLQATIPFERFGPLERQPARFSLTGVSLNSAAGRPLEGILFRPGVGFGHTRALVAQVEIDPLTPPGRYEGVLAAGKSRCPAVFLVSERCALRFLPSRLCICEPPGTEVSRNVVMINAGNAPMTVGEGHVVALLQDVFWCRKGREAVRNRRLDKEQLTWDEVVTVAVHELQDAFREEPPLRVRFIDGPLRVMAGGSHEAVIGFTVPPQLRPNRRYRGTVRLFNTTLSLEFYHTTVETEGGDRRKPDAVLEKPPSRRTPSPSKRRKKLLRSEAAESVPKAV
jgi:hypothetical protein